MNVRVSVVAIGVGHVAGGLIDHFARRRRRHTRRRPHRDTRWTAGRTRRLHHSARRSHCPCRRRPRWRRGGRSRSHRCNQCGRPRSRRADRPLRASWRSRHTRRRPHRGTRWTAGRTRRLHRSARRSRCPARRTPRSRRGGCRRPYHRNPGCRTHSPWAGCRLASSAPDRHSRPRPRRGTTLNRSRLIALAVAVIVLPVADLGRAGWQVAQPSSQSVLLDT